MSKNKYLFVWNYEKMKEIAEKTFPALHTQEAIDNLRDVVVEVCNHAEVSLNVFDMEFPAITYQSDAITAADAHKGSINNIDPEEKIDQKIMVSVFTMIRKEMKTGGFSILVHKSWVSIRIKSELEAMGYTVSYENGFSLMDSDKWRIKW